MSDSVFNQPSTEDVPSALPMDWITEPCAANNHGMPRGGNGVGGAAGTHENHHGGVLAAPLTALDVQTRNGGV